MTSLNGELGLVRYSSSGAGGISGEETFDLIVGADGGGSLVRNAMKDAFPGFKVTSTEVPNYSLMLHMDLATTSALDPGWLHIMAPPPIMYVAGAINGNDAHGKSRDDPKWFCQIGFSGKKEFKTLSDVHSLLKHCPEILKYSSEAAIADLVDRPILPTGKSKTCSSLAVKRCILLGDAAAPFPPVGQGVNAAMEGATYLDRCIGDYVARAQRAFGQGASASSIEEDLASIGREYDAMWGEQAAAMREIAQQLDLRSTLMPVKTLFYQTLGVAALSTSKRSDLSYKQALEREKLVDRLFVGGFGVVIAAVGVGFLWGETLQTVTKRNSNEEFPQRG